ncbi:hypothetical protein [Oceanobacter kriegii]|uniref:hypothetical protein n=1 Tax=Oceanobacter kriegii TaxID=64972 RepID=UPI0004048028|nr:hypothetical protein [Oceanobacter kriegii]
MSDSAVSILSVQPSLAGQKAGLEKRITARLNQLSRVVQTAESKAVAQLSQFVMDYCMYFLELENTLADNAPKLLQRIHSAMPLLEMCAPVNSCGSVMLMRRAWFALRVAEEMNDLWLSRTGETLTNHDLATANIVVQALLDEDDADMIDSLVNNSCRHPERLFYNTHAVDQQPGKVSRICQHWPCLADAFGLPSAIV